MAKKPTAKPVRKSRQAQRPAAVQHARHVASTEGIKVRVLEGRVGYFDHSRRREGDVFTIPNEEAFSERWMERVDEETPDRLTTAKGALAKETARIRGDKFAEAAAEKDSHNDDVI